MSKIRMALVDKGAAIGIMWLNPMTRKAELLRVSIPHRKQAIIKKALAVGMDFPKVAPEKEINLVRPDGTKIEKSSLLVPESAIQADSPQKAGPKIITE